MSDNEDNVNPRSSKFQLEGVPQDHRVRVAVRIRPFNRADHNDTSICLSVDGNKISAQGPSKSASFTFDFVFQGNQEEVYKSIGEGMLQDAFEGYNSTIFAYGQTGSGKTYSMVGVENSKEHEGLLPRICKELFEISGALQAEDPALICKIQVSFVEVYNEMIHDLLQMNNGQHPVDSSELKPLKLKEDKKTKGYFVDQLSLHTVTSYLRVKNLIDIGTHLRTKAETGMNELSSRSHSVFCIYLSQTHEPPDASHRDVKSKMTIVDLAGSERQSKTDIGADAKRVNEANRINMSLLVLGRCLSACSDPSSKGHIPIRESVLTKMLMDIFGGNSKTMMFAAVSPSSFNFAETMSTLQYAHNAKKIKNKAKVNTMAKAIEIKELKEQVKALGKTLIEELEKAAQEKERLDTQIQAIFGEKENIRSALETSHTENELLKQKLREIMEENMKLKEQMASGDFEGPGEDGAERPPRPKKKRAAKKPAPVVDEEEEQEEDGEGGEQGVEGAPGQSARKTKRFAQQESDDDGEMDKEQKLAEIHAELTRKLHLVNPSLPSHTARSDAETHRDATSRGPVTASSNEIRSYVGHGSAVYCCAFSPAGDKMVSASRDRTLKIWLVKSGQELITLKGHNGFVLSCAFSPSGNEVASTSDDKTIKVWDAATGKKLLTMKGHNDKVYCCSYSPKGTEIASASCDKTAKVWSSENGKKLVTLRNHSSAVFCASFSQDGTKLATASDDKTIRIWDWAEQAELMLCQGHTGTVWSCMFDATGSQILSASMDCTIKLWDASNGTMLKTFRGHSAPVHHAIFAKDCSKVVSASRDRTLKVWDTESTKVLSTMVGHTNTVYHCCVFNNLILSCSSDDILKVWNLKA